MNTLTHADILVGDIVCLNQYPYKPFEVVYKRVKPHADLRVGIVLKDTGRTKSRMFFTLDEFDQAGYIKYGGKP